MQNFFVFLIGILCFSTKIALNTNIIYSIFNKKLNYEILNEYEQQRFLIYISPFKNKIYCLSKCSLLENCSLVEIKNKTCKYYSKLGTYYLAKSINKSLIYFRKNLDLFLLNTSRINGLKNYWSFSNDSLDIIGENHMFGGFNWRFAEDKFGSKLSAIRFEMGFREIQSGVYFDTDFTISVWVKMYNFSNLVRLLDFASIPGQDNFYINLYDNSPKNEFFLELKIH